MLQVQKWLKEHDNLDMLENQLGITHNLSSVDSRVILNYSQIESPKTNPIVRECRGLVLDTVDWSLVARSFSRFFNWGEVLDERDNFNWNDCVCQHKEDGSLILLYHWRGNWHINTRNSFGGGEVNDSGYTWRELFNSCVDYKDLPTQYTYVFELCSPYNKIVRTYSNATAYLLTIYDKHNELPFHIYKESARIAGLNTPSYHTFDHINMVHDYIDQLSQNDNTFEGIVLRDSDNRRWKVKSAKYVALHRMFGNGNLFSVKNLLPFVLAGETAELLTYYPEASGKVNELAQKIENWKKELDNLWFVYHDEHSQKKFALAIKNHPLSSILFEARKRDCDWKDIFKDSYKIILNKLE